MCSHSRGYGDGTSWSLCVFNSSGLSTLLSVCACVMVTTGLGGSVSSTVAVYLHY